MDLGFNLRTEHFVIELHMAQSPFTLRLSKQP